MDAVDVKRSILKPVLIAVLSGGLLLGAIGCSSADSSPVLNTMSKVALQSSIQQLDDETQTQVRAALDDIGFTFLHLNWIEPVVDDALIARFRQIRKQEVGPMYSYNGWASASDYVLRVVEGMPVDRIIAVGEKMQQKQAQWQAKQQTNMVDIHIKRMQ